MAFFTRVNLNVPVLPPEELGAESICSSTSHTHRKYASEPVTSAFINSTTTRSNNISGGSALPVTKSNSVTDRSATNVVAVIVNADEVALSNVDSKSVNAKGRPAVETEARSSENGEREVLPKSTEKNGNGEPKRYEYVVDRVLGVEV